MGLPFQGGGVEELEGSTKSSGPSATERARGLGGWGDLLRSVRRGTGGAELSVRRGTGGAGLLGASWTRGGSWKPGSGGNSYTSGETLSLEGERKNRET